MTQSRILSKRLGQTIPTPDSPRPADTTPPTAPGTPVVNMLTADSAMLTFAAATDAVGVVGYAAFLDGSSTPAAYSAGNTASITLTGLLPGSHSVTVKAFDAAWNWSAASAAVGFTISDGAKYTSITSGNKLDVRLFGAKCDCTGPGTGTDNASAVQAAVTYLLSIQSSSRPTLYFPEVIGYKYRIGSTVTVNRNTSDAKGFTLEGDSKYGGGILYTGNGDLFVFGDGAGTSTAQIQYVTAKNLRLDGNSSASGFAINGSPLVHPRFYDCLLLQWPTSGAFKIGYGFSGNFNGNTITACKDGMDFRGIGGTSGQSNAVQLNGNTIYSLTGHGVRLKDCFAWLMNGGTVENCYKSGIFVEPNNVAIQILGVYFELNASVGMNFYSPAVNIKANIIVNGGAYSDETQIPMACVYPSSLGVIGTYNSSYHADYHIYAPGATKGLIVSGNFASTNAAAATYVSATQCTVSGDVTNVFASKYTNKRRLIKFNTANGDRTGIIRGANYSAGTTTITIEPTTDGFDASLTTLQYAPALVGCYGGMYPDSPRIKNSGVYLPHLDNLRISGNTGFYGHPIVIESQPIYQGIATAAITAGATSFTTTFAWNTAIGSLLHDSGGVPFAKIVGRSGTTVTITGINGTGGALFDVPTAGTGGFGVYASSTYGILEYDDCPSRIYADTASQVNYLPAKIETWADIDASAPATVFSRSSAILPKFPDAIVYELAFATAGATSAYGFSIATANYKELWGAMCSFGVWIKASSATSGVGLVANNVLGGAEWLYAYAAASTNTDWIYQTIVFKFPKTGTLQFGVKRYGTDNTSVQIALPTFAELGADIPAIWGREGVYRKSFDLLSAPTVGTWKTGDMASAHVCTAAGTPGTWT